MRLLSLLLKSPRRITSSHTYPVFSPPTPEKLLAHVTRYRGCLFQRGYRTLQGRTGRQPAVLVISLYERLVLNDNFGLRNEIKYFFYAKWPVASIPDRLDPSESRYALLSATPALLVESFSRPIDLGLPRTADPSSHARNWNRISRKRRPLRLFRA
ncbi:hypothetical protein BDW75DRAFT_68883 [Aspergillus navahoensis]